MFIKPKLKHNERIERNNFLAKEQLKKFYRGEKRQSDSENNSDSENTDDGDKTPRDEPEEDDDWKVMNAEKQLDRINKEFHLMTIEVKDMMESHNQSMLKLAQ